MLPKNILDGFQLGYKFYLELKFLASASEWQKFNFILSQGKFTDIGFTEDYKYALGPVVQALNNLKTRVF